ncbi:unnamed protein product [Adineta steineri]|uniref:Uncharacterized protein n=1 Tax=Adineta steineri TaxID=433720 RepID=A0A813YZB9_9BILA|nr:unnamed protein product [Adineta steineri]CAF0942925.1 unnamed protein product [Adineta steineri]CAF3707477.1 unnamed protein product [Adineta steineri]CAF3889312.1 unnamed protein product [Adineta steineri]
MKSPKYHGTGRVRVGLLDLGDMIEPVSLRRGRFDLQMKTGWFPLMIVNDEQSFIPLQKALLRTAEQIYQKAKLLIQTTIDNFPIFFTSDYF